MTNELLREAASPGPSTTPGKKPRKKRRLGSVVLNTVGVLLLVAGGVLAGSAYLAPEGTERAYGTMKSTFNRQVQEVQEQVFDSLPTVRKGVSGGIEEIDWCDGTFTEVLSYEQDGVPPVWAAHNNCGGDVILPWEEGQKMQFEGDDTVYEVVDIVYTSKTWSTTQDLIGLTGEISLQSCFYGEDRMKFVGLSPLKTP